MKHPTEFYLPSQLSLQLGYNKNWISDWLRAHPGEEPPGLNVKRIKGRVAFVQPTLAFFKWVEGCSRKRRKTA